MKLGEMQEFEDRCRELNQEQREAVNTVEGPLLVLAGPGTGKTELLSMRTAKILLEKDVNPEEILILTFTDSAARNMTDRLFNLIGRRAYKVRISTFHSLANSIIQEYGEYFYQASLREPITELRQVEILESVFAKMRYGEPLYGYNEVRGYTYLKPSAWTIKKIKEYGLKAEDYQNLINKTAKEYEEVDKIIKESWPKGASHINLQKEYLVLAKKLQDLSSNATAQYLAHNLANSIESDLEFNTEHATKKSTQLIKFKEQYILENKKTGEFNFKKLTDVPKLKQFAEIYKIYEHKLEKLGFYDYADMILDVLYALKNNPDLLNQIETKYQYLMLDEFQDTNQAQLELANLLIYKGADNNPNFCAVGDDDQGIYKFQGAEINNMMKFYQTYPKMKLISLVENYRSTKNVLDISRSVIEQVSKRLETSLKNEIGEQLLKKSLNPNTQHKELPERFLAFEDSDLELAWIAQNIRELLDSGVRAEEIAVLAKKHINLQSLVPYLDYFSVPYSYERESTLLEQENIRAIVNLIKVLNHLETDSQSVEYLLSEVLVGPFFNLPREKIWRIALASQVGKKSWLNIILESGEFSEVKARLDEYLNLKNELDLINFIYQIIDPKFSNYKQYFFSDTHLQEKEINYFKELEAIKTLVANLLEWGNRRTLHLRDLEEFLKYTESLENPIRTQVEITTALAHINLMTVYKAKGLEWEYVYILDVDQNTWSAKNITGAKIPLPCAEVETIDRLQADTADIARTLFVAITRAKFGLTLTTASTWSEFLNDNKIVKTNLKNFKDTVPKAKYQKLSREAREIIFTKNWKVKLSKSESEILRNKLKDYTMSPTHLNNFLDLYYGEGPMSFYEDTILRYPRKPNESLSFGQAFHKAIEFIIQSTNGELIHPEFKRVFEIFKQEIVKDYYGLEDKEKEILLKEGEDSLKHYYEQEIKNFEPGSQSEIDFKKIMGPITIVHPDNPNKIAKITGKIDYLRKHNKGHYEVIDFKTGSQFGQFDFTAKTKDKKVKMIKYHDQLLFYKILLKHTPEYQYLYQNLELGIQFVETKKEDLLKNPKIKTVYLESNLVNEEVIQEMEKLIVNIYQNIVNVSLPEISKFEKTPDGILEFRQDLIDGKI